MGRQVELGTTIRITRRNHAKHVTIQLHYCEFQYHGILKAERQVNVQVVLLFTLIVVYQDCNLEVIQKYGDGDIAESS